MLVRRQNHGLEIAVAVAREGVGARLLDYANSFEARWRARAIPD
jgi:hypothetical protein